MNNKQKVQAMLELITWARGQLDANKDAFPPDDGDSLFAVGKRYNKIAEANLVTFTDFYNHAVNVIEEGVKTW